MVLVIAVALLSLSFATHLFLWRCKVPKHATSTLLLIFFIVPLIFCLITNAATMLPLFDILRLALLYFGCTLVYIILYSAIEQQSPTLSIIFCIKNHGITGCSDDALIQYLSADNVIKERLYLMNKEGWLKDSDKGWQLTKKGHRIAHLFDYTANIFCLGYGG